LVLNNPTDRTFARLSKDIVKSQLDSIEHLADTSEVWHFIHIPNCVAKCVDSNPVQKFFCTCLAWPLLIWRKRPAAFSILTMHNQ